MPDLGRLMRITGDRQWANMTGSPELWLCHATMDVLGIHRYYYRESRPSRNRKLRVDWYPDGPFVFELQDTFADNAEFNSHLSDRDSNFCIRALRKNLEKADEAVYRHLGEPETGSYNRIDLAGGGVLSHTDGQLTCYTLYQADNPSSVLSIDQSGGMTRIYWGYEVPSLCFEDL